jgi:subtilisin family serine protease
VASLLVAQAGADLYAADVYCGAAAGAAVDAIAAALEWLDQEQVPVINVSLVGPRNALLERIVGALTARGHLIVAAVGNDGPAAPPLYPAAYAGVVGVTAVDAKRRVLLEAERGPQVMFAARGADLMAANLDHGYSAVRGTSFAAPTVAALLARSLADLDPHAAGTALQALAQSAIDLGPRGRDLTYGFGLVGADTR